MTDNIILEIDQASNNKQEHYPHQEQQQMTDEEKMKKEQQEQIAELAKKLQGDLQTLQNQVEQEQIENSSRKYFVQMLSAALFGGLFVGFHENNDYTDNCGKTQFLDWCLATGIFYLAFCGVQFFFFVASLCDNLKATIYTLENKIVKYLNGIASFIFAVALVTLDEESCGSIHKLAMAYYILAFIGIGIAVIAILCMCCMFGKMAREMKKEEVKQQKH